MGYVALYRQFRPKSFDSMAGQEHIVRTLKNQIKNNRISHAYLFCGPRGTGKTSAALVFAHAVNCKNPVDGDVCGECEYCAQAGENIDITEIDAASNNGVDEIRDLREMVRYMPAVGRYKVYIIDEVHMLSPGAFNALLKTLEEPPPYVIFILATTEVHKIPATIISRCQRFDFKAITVREIMGVLSGIAAKMNITADEDALAAIARWANGGLRDAIGLFDQSIDFANGYITLDSVNQVIGTTGIDFTISFIEALAEGNSALLLEKINEIVNMGKDLSVFVKDITNHLRNILMFSLTKSADILDSSNEETVRRYERAADKFTSTRLLRAIEQLSLLESELRYTAQPRILVELALIKICRPEVSDDIDSLRDTVEQLQKKLESGAFSLKTSKKSSVDEVPLPEPPPENDFGHAEPVSQAKTAKPKQAQQTGSLEQIWTEYLNELKKVDVRTYGYLKNTVLRQISDDVAEIIFSAKDSIFAQTLERPEKKELIQNAISQKAGKAINITVKCENSVKETGSEKIEKALQGFLDKDKIEIV